MEVKSDEQIKQEQDKAERECDEIMNKPQPKGNPFIHLRRRGIAWDLLTIPKDMSIEEWDGIAPSVRRTYEQKGEIGERKGADEIVLIKQNRSWGISKLHLKSVEEWLGIVQRVKQALLRGI